MNFLLILTLFFSTIPDPVMVNDSAGLPWFRGAIPETPTNTVLVFVHGKHDDETIWFGDVKHYGHNKMYEMAYNAGYRTAFVRLGAESSMWYNGRILAEQLTSIERYFDTRNIVIIAHSKGGIDAQAALVYYNTVGVPRKLITLSTPYYGSPLADLIFSNFYTAWLGLIIGQATPAAFVLQTAYMREFEDRIANDPDNQYLYYYTMSGWDIGPFPLWLGGVYLALHGGDIQHGGNDGAVTFQSAHVNFPHSERISLAAYEDPEHKWFFNHFNIRLGQNTWYYIDSLINIYPVIPASYRENSPNTKNGYITLMSAGFIKSSSIDKKLSLNVNKGCELYILANGNTSVKLNGTDIRNRLTTYQKSDIKFLKLTSGRKSNLTLNGDYFILGIEKDNPLRVQYKPLVVNEVPHIKISLKNAENITYKAYVKVYSLQGTFLRDMTLEGTTTNQSSLTLPFFHEGLYNVALDIQAPNTERTVVFTMIVKTDEHPSEHNNIQTAQISEVKNIHSRVRYFDILGRRGAVRKSSGIFFESNGGKSKPIIVIK